MKFQIFLAVTLLAVVSCDLLSPDQQVPIVRQSQDINVDGSYQYSYETANGIAGHEQGIGGHSAQGSSQYTAPDGTPIQLQYIADENGFQPQGAHLPTSPPIPDAILRALEYIRTHPPHQDQELKSHQQPAGFQNYHQ